MNTIRGRLISYSTSIRPTVRAVRIYALHTASNRLITFSWRCTRLELQDGRLRMIHSIEPMRAEGRLSGGRGMAYRWQRRTSDQVGTWT